MIRDCACANAVSSLAVWDVFAAALAHIKGDIWRQVNKFFLDLVNKLLDWNKLFRKRIYHQKLNLCTGPDLSFLSSYSSTSWMYHNQRYLNGYLRWNSTKFYNFEHTLKTDHFCSPIKTKLYDTGKPESHLDKVQFSDHALVLNLFICF